MYKTKYELEDGHMTGKVICHHQFWRDENPPGCLNCGKTKGEILIDYMDEQMYDIDPIKKQRILARLQTKVDRL